MNNNKYMKPTAIIYIRVSTTRQADSGYSLDQQLRDCKKHIVENGLTLQKIYREEGESAKTADRPLLQDALEYCSKNNINFFIVHKRDRFSRNLMDALTLEHILSKSGTLVVSVTEPLTEDEYGMSEMYKIIQYGMAQTENKMRAKRVKDGMKSGLEDGHWYWPVPFGLKKIKDSDNKPIVVRDENNASVIGGLFRKYISGEIRTQKEIAEVLNRQGHKTPKGNPFSKQTVSTMLKNPLYAGIISTSLISEPVSDKFSIITIEEHKKILQIIEGRNNRRAWVKYREEYPLRAFLSCGSCNKPIRGSASVGNGGSYPKYHCSSCRKSSIDSESLNKEFYKLLKGLEPTGEMKKLFREIFLRKYRDMNMTQELELNKARDKRSKLTKKRDKIFDLYCDNKITQVEKDKYSFEIEVCLTDLDLEIAKLQQDYSKVDAVLAFGMKFFSNCAELWNRSDIVHKIRLQELIFPEGLVFDFKNGFGTAKLGTLYEVIKANTNTQSNMVIPRGIEPRLPD